MMNRLSFILPVLLAWSCAGAADFGPGPAVDRALQQNQLLRQQQQDQLQLKMQQYQSSARSPAQDARQHQALEQLEINQALRQQQLQLQQQRDLQARPDAPGDDEGVRRAKAELDQVGARQAAQRQLHQFDRELRSREGERLKAEGNTLPVTVNRGIGLLPPGLPPSTVAPLPQ